MLRTTSPRWENDMQNIKLKNCKACGKEISPLSPFCRQCGHPQGSMVAIWLLALFGVVLLAAYLAFCLYGITLCR
jgi:predicted amidophosphoribosyltransferase